MDAAFDYTLPADTQPGEAGPPAGANPRDLRVLRVSSVLWAPAISA
jgi:hypothetical protein